ncbi:MAG: serine esterase [Candidatus Pelagibacter sp. TMED272]|nr:serine esterase [Pelagibacteraceae bacterium]RPG93684.1 MAG: serine esterase [Candidatus Pelagibacter sp. TMED272]|tara:strand:- start:3530 stop:4183 length:654 start_codon:yes stop_codon:yes gene_type:complete
MTYSLNTIILEPVNKKKPKNAVILCHGYGGDGKDISILANYWRAHLPETLFICPDAPEKCVASPTGFQWFDLLDQSPEQILSKSIVAETKLNKLIDEVKLENKLNANQIIIGGFSQGCMICIQTGIKRKDKINSIIGYSGKIINTNHLSKNMNSRPNLILMHGDIDQVVTIEAFLEAKHFFRKNNYEIESRIFKNCEHRIPTEGSSLGLQFIKKHLE